MSGRPFHDDSDSPGRCPTRLRVGDPGPRPAAADRAGAGSSLRLLVATGNLNGCTGAQDRGRPMLRSWKLTRMAINFKPTSSETLENLKAEDSESQL